MGGLEERIHRAHDLDNLQRIVKKMCSIEQSVRSMTYLKELELLLCDPEAMLDSRVGDVEVWRC